MVDTIADFGGKLFKRNLLKNLIEDVDDELMDSIIYNYLVQRGGEDMELASPPTRKVLMESSAEEDFTSCDESAEEQEGRGL